MESLFPAGEEPLELRSSGRRKRRWWMLGGAVSALVVVSVFAAVIKVPYYTLAPGSLRPTEPSVVIEGAPTYREGGEIGYMTVTFDQASLLGLAWASVHPDIEILSEQEALGGHDREENREINRQLMASAKEVSTAVALEALGYEVTVVGTGALVLDVEPGTPAADVLVAGDTVVAVDGEPVVLSDDLSNAITERGPGDEVVLTVESGEQAAEGANGSEEVGTPEREPGETREVRVTLAARDDDPEAGFLGVVFTTRDGAFEFPLVVTIDSGEVLGPSAGLAFSLTLIDLLTPNSLTGGERVAVTGTINVDGTVGRVGGTAQKTVAARNAGATMFLVPEAEAEVAERHAGHDMRIVAVGSLDDALAVLAQISGDTSVVDQVAAGRESPAD